MYENMHFEFEGEIREECEREFYMLKKKVRNVVDIMYVSTEDTAILAA
jgi:hypothetical protein